MPGFFLYTSNRMEHLADVLAQIVSRPKKIPLSPEVIVVQNRGMQRWLTLQLSDRLGIWSNCEYPFPNSFINSLFCAAFPEHSKQLLFEPDILQWRILNVLPRFLDNDFFSELKTYLSDSDYLKLFELSRKIADQFDQYTVYRPEMILGWEQGKGNDWQSILWRDLSKKEIYHRAKLKHLFLDKVLKKQISAEQFPERVMVFGISVLPPYHVEMLEAVSSLIDVHLFLLNPCAEYWDDIFSSREISRHIKKFRKSRKKDIKKEMLHIEQGNPLLASLGLAGRDFIAKLHYCTEEISFPVEPDTNLSSGKHHTLLQLLQSDMLHLRDRTENNQLQQPISSTDISIQIHSCHSPMRELEVLYDNLLNMFEQYNDLTPSDIVVMTPDINLYAPFIEAVFNTYEDTKLKLPFSIADRNLQNESHLSEIFLSMLELSESRFTVTSILDILEVPEVRDSFNIKIEQLDTIRNWIKNTGIRWGVDKDALTQLGLPGFSSNTWGAGINRLLMGYALPSENENFFKEIAGFDNIEGTDIDILGNFLDFFTDLVDFRRIIQSRYSLDRWSQLLLESLDSFFKVPSEKEQEMIAIRNCLFEIGKEANEAGFKELVDVSILKSAFSEKITKLSLRPGFITGGITFCAMLPMRSIPFKIVCLIGFNEDTFPRKSTYHSWDLIAQSPKPGDRSLQSEDRYLFLETILSARDIWYVSYIGNSNYGDGFKRPSVLVQEVLDYIQKGFYSENDSHFDNHKYRNDPDSDTKLSGEEKNDKKHGTPFLTNSYEFIEQIKTQHRLQAFNSAYFEEGSKLYSYSLENYKAATLLKSGGGNKKEPFFVDILNKPSKEFYNITIGDLCNFFKNPCRFLLKQRCGISFSIGYEEIPQDEPFYIRGLDKYKITDYLAQKYISGKDAQKTYEYLKLSGLLPHGSVGETSFEELSLNVQSFIERFKAYQQCEKLPDIQTDYKFCDIHVCGNITNIYKNYRLSFRYSDTKAFDLIDSWLNHLFLNAAKICNYPVTSLLFTRDRNLFLPEIEDFSEIINNLLNLYMKGLCEPLPFFPASSLLYAELVLLKKKTSEEALTLAKRKWYGDQYNIYAEGFDPYNKLCNKEINPFNENFTQTALSVYEPLIKNMQKLEQ